MLFVRCPRGQSWFTGRCRDTRYQNLGKAKPNDYCVTNYRQATDPHESKGGEIRYKILQRVVQHCFVASLGRCFAFFTLRDQHVAQQKCLLILCYRLKEVVTKSRARVYFEQQISALLLVFHQTYNLSRNKFSQNF